MAHLVDSHVARLAAEAEHGEALVIIIWLDDGDHALDGLHVLVGVRTQIVQGRRRGVVAIRSCVVDSDNG